MYTDGANVIYNKERLLELINAIELQISEKTPGNSNTNSSLNFTPFLQAVPLLIHECLHIALGHVSYIETFLYNNNISPQRNPLLYITVLYLYNYCIDYDVNNLTNFMTRVFASRMSIEKRYIHDLTDDEGYVNYISIKNLADSFGVKDVDHTTSGFKVFMGIFRELILKFEKIPDDVKKQIDKYALDLINYTYFIARQYDEIYNLYEEIRKLMKDLDKISQSRALTREDTTSEIRKNMSKLNNQFRNLSDHTQPLGKDFIENLNYEIENMKKAFNDKLENDPDRMLLDMLMDVLDDIFSDYAKNTTSIAYHILSDQVSFVSYSKLKDNNQLGGFQYSDSLYNLINRGVLNKNIDVDNISEREIDRLAEECLDYHNKSFVDSAIQSNKRMDNIVDFISPVTAKVTFNMIKNAISDSGVDKNMVEKALDFMIENISKTMDLFNKEREEVNKNLSDLTPEYNISYNKDQGTDLPDQTLMLQVIATNQEQLSQSRTHISATEEFSKLFDLYKNNLIDRNEIARKIIADYLSKTISNHKPSNQLDDSNNHPPFNKDSGSSQIPSLSNGENCQMPSGQSSNQNDSHCQTTESQSGTQNSFSKDSGSSQIPSLSNGENCQMLSGQSSNQDDSHCQMTESQSNTQTCLSGQMAGEMFISQSNIYANAQLSPFENKHMQNHDIQDLYSQALDHIQRKIEELARELNEKLAKKHEDISHDIEKRIDKIADFFGNFGVGDVKNKFKDYLSKELFRMLVESYSKIDQDKINECRENIRIEVTGILNDQETMKKIGVGMGQTLRNIFDRPAIEKNVKRYLPHIHLHRLVAQMIKDRSNALTRRSWSGLSPLGRINEIPLPKTTLKDISALLIVDVSGSIANEDLKRAASVIFPLFKRFKELRMVFWDDGLQADKVIKNIRELENIKVNGGGGTSIDEALRYVFGEKNKRDKQKATKKEKNYGLVVILTDLYSTWHNVTDINLPPYTLVVDIGTQPSVITFPAEHYYYHIATDQYCYVNKPTNCLVNS
ncbi:MAG: VWA-like domain-containing protein [Methylacidiphilales bacterium]|nr:VWA-like domain-containing protein [Candidatus Methylacidiphilales bacterium]